MSPTYAVQKSHEMSSELLWEMDEDIMQKGIHKIMHIMQRKYTKHTTRVFSHTN